MQATSLRFCLRWAVDSFRIVTEPIDPLGMQPEAAEGASVSFLGSVRDADENGRPVRALFYEAFEPMALSEFESIAREARERFGQVRLTIVHRVGEVAVGDVSVAVTTCAAHRTAAFDACRYAIDELKRRAPIWKKELYVDGGGDWISNGF